ncbi:hypothetical protein O9993_01400 [Vibrio lentus]|nr:hypothetical protein [Vibrio lentus]
MVNLSLQEQMRMSPWYSPKWEMFSIVRKVILRMQSWQKLGFFKVNN